MTDIDVTKIEKLLHWLETVQNRPVSHTETWCDGWKQGARSVQLEIAKEIENHSYLADTDRLNEWIDSLTKRLREEAK